MKASLGGAALCHWCGMVGAGLAPLLAAITNGSLMVATEFRYPARLA